LKSIRAPCWQIVYSGVELQTFLHICGRSQCNRFRSTDDLRRDRSNTLGFVRIRREMTELKRLEENRMFRHFLEKLLVVFRVLLTANVIRQRYPNFPCNPNHFAYNVDI
jgi:hypothetical protein